MTNEKLFEQAANAAREYLDTIGDRTVRATATAEELRRQLGGRLDEHGSDPAEAIRLLADAARMGTVATQGPRFFGFVVGSSLPVATAADWLVSAWDQNAAVDVLSPLNAAVEHVASDWMRTLLGLPAEWSVGFVTGASMATFTGLAAARRHVLQTVGWDVEADGLFGAPPIEVVVSEDAHYSIYTALRMLGLGAERVHRVATDAQGRMRPDALTEVLDQTGPQVIVCAQLGNVNTGACDPIDAIADIVAERAGWMHVDAAFGGWAAVSPSRRYLVAGMDRADSLTIDAHKWLNVPYDSGIVFCAHPDAHRGAMTLAAPYIQQSRIERDPREFTPEESRRARAVPVYAALRTLGCAGVAELVDRCCDHARRFAEGLEEAGYEVLNDVVLNQVLVSFGEPEKTHRVIAAIQADGTCWCGGTEWKGRVAMRISVSSWATTDTDVERSLERMLELARSA